MRLFAGRLPPPPPPPYDCEGEFAKLEATHAIHFAFDRWDLPETSRDLVKRVAEFLNDERCSDRRLIVKGHADYFGGRLYNRALSIRRAQAVIDALAGEYVLGTLSASARRAVARHGWPSAFWKKRSAIRFRCWRSILKGI